MIRNELIEYIVYAKIAQREKSGLVINADRPKLFKQLCQLQQIHSTETLQKKALCWKNKGYIPLN